MVMSSSGLFCFFLASVFSLVSVTVRDAYSLLAFNSFLCFLYVVLVKYHTKRNCSNYNLRL